MIRGLGIDIVEVKRISKIMKSKGGQKFITKILTEKEIKSLKNSVIQRQIEKVSGLFALKEAFSKALGVGISKDLGFQDIEVSKNKKGAPSVKYLGKKAKFLNRKVSCSLSHDRAYAVAIVILE